MTKLFLDPAEFSEDQLDGFVDLYSDRLTRVTGGVVTHPPKEPQVAVVVGGGSGHYPAFAGLVGPGFASGAVVGNIFTSPSAAHVYSVAKAANQGKGVILTFGNYAGDNMNFGITAKRLNAEGIDTRIVVVTDDVASASTPEDRRGIAGDFTVFKAMSAAAAAGKSLDEVERIGRHANDMTRTMGVAFSGCTMPGATEPLFEVPQGKMGVGLGIHGEPGIKDETIGDAEEIADLLVSHVLDAAPSDAASDRVAVILNGLGATKYEELFLTYGKVAAKLRAAGLSIVEPEVGELVTSLDMGGISLTLMWLDDELEAAWHAEAYACGYRKSHAPLKTLDPTAVSTATNEAEAELTEPEGDAVAVAEQVRRGIGIVAQLMKDQESHLGKIDAIAGDGDHGRGMVRGTSAAQNAVDKLVAKAGFTPSASDQLRTAGAAWALEAGGTSGVLWGAGLEAAAGTSTVAEGVAAFADTVQQLGGAQVGDKTLLDALIPFRDALGAGSSFSDAADVAVKAAAATSDLVPRKGRAAPLAEKSVGHPDAGAISFSMIAQRLAEEFTQEAN
ncbi:dihydroxyacetone kinase family protein [Corynebacterium sp. Marseille-P8863]|uniref:dihydroxyacetone kinase family protein n=1 Tax=Corynebacterium sp. Marseille-P8863 TaxID=2866576 RepID=UPI0022646606|nr:dihydroxyacetone kinase family protein [Corynebacterium sp. Marseille-P8863]